MCIELAIYRDISIYAPLNPSDLAFRTSMVDMASYSRELCPERHLYDFRSNRLRRCCRPQLLAAVRSTARVTHAPGMSVRCQASRREAILSV